MFTLCGHKLPAPCRPATLLQELQQQNARLLAVNRQLAAEAEGSREEAEAAVRAEYGAAVERLSAELEGLRASRRDTEELLAQVGRAGRGGRGGRAGGRTPVGGALPTGQNLSETACHSLALLLAPAHSSPQEQCPQAPCGRGARCPRSVSSLSPAAGPQGAG